MLPMSSQNPLQKSKGGSTQFAEAIATHYITCLSASHPPAKAQQGILALEWFETVLFQQVIDLCLYFLHVPHVLLHLFHPPQEPHLGILAIVCRFNCLILASPCFMSICLLFLVWCFILLQDICFPFLQCILLSVHFLSYDFLHCLFLHLNIFLLYFFLTQGSLLSCFFLSQDSYYPAS